MPLNFTAITAYSGHHMLDPPEKSRMQRRAERVREISQNRGPASGKQLIVAGATAGLVAGLLVFMLAASAGLIVAAWHLGALAMVFGTIVGIVLGVKTPPGGIMAGFLSGVWFVVHIVGAAAMLASEFLAGAMLLSLFSCG